MFNTGITASTIIKLNTLADKDSPAGEKASTTKRVNHISMVITYIVNNLNRIANKPNVGQYEEGVVMMKYSEIGITRIVN